MSTTSEHQPAAGPQLSAQTQQRLEQELDDLRAQRRQLDEAINETDGVDDGADAAQRLERADERALLDSRADDITRLLSGEVDRSAEGGLADGTEVSVRFDDGTVSTMTVVIVPDAAPESKEVLTADSPLGQALVDAKPGDTVTYDGPEGEIVVEVLAIRLPGSSQRPR